MKGHVTKYHPTGYLLTSKEKVDDGDEETGRILIEPN